MLRVLQDLNPEGLLNLEGLFEGVKSRRNRFGNRSHEASMVEGAGDWTVKRTDLN